MRTKLRVLLLRGRRSRRLTRPIGALSGAALLLGITAFFVALPAAASDPAATCGTTGVLAGNGLGCAYDTVGSDTFNPPAGVISATFTVIGAQGGTYTNPAVGTPHPGGAGGEAQGTLAVTPTVLLQVDVAGTGGTGNPTSSTGGMNGGPSGGTGGAGGFGGSNGGVPGGPGDASGGTGGTNAFNGGNGSGGGGSSDVRRAPSGCGSLTCGLSTRAFVGGGGGGVGGNGGRGNAVGGNGGGGGGTTGGDGSNGGGGNPGALGTGAIQAAGGVGGLHPDTGHNGGNGLSGLGGNGGDGNDPHAGAGGGGGGGGFFGGGGGSGGGGNFGGGGGAGGGAGGGSGFIAPSVTNGTLTASVNDVTTNNGNGEVIVTWTSVPTLQQLLIYVTGIGPGTSLADKVQGAITALQAGATSTACGDLGALINQAKAQTGKHLPAVQANAIIEATDRIQTALGC
jgi:hypothetical protein